MTDSYLGEIQAFAFSYPPRNWMPCDGRLLPIQQYSALFSLLGVSYGGNGTQNFALPNLVSNVAMSQGQGPGLQFYTLGESLGETGVTLSTSEMPMHAHGLQLGDKTSLNATTGPSATSNVAVDPNFNGFVPLPTTTAFAPNSVTMTGGSQPHPNTQPALAMIYCICVNGIFPSFGMS